MKKLLSTLAIGLFLIFVSKGQAAVIYGSIETAEARGIEVTAAITAAANGSVDDSYLSDSLNRVLQFQRGYKLSIVRVFFGSPAPDDNSDFTLVESANGVDVLGGAGANTIDAATNNSFLPLVGSTPVEAPVYGPLILKISGNSVNGAKFRIVFDFIPMCP